MNVRYVCHIGFSMAAAILLCACLLPERIWIPAAIALAVLGFAGFLLRGRFRQRMLLRISLCLTGAALGFGIYAVHWNVNVLPARALNGSVVNAVVELRETPEAARYGSSALGWLELDGKRYPTLCYLDADDPGQPGERITGSFRLKLPADEENGTADEPGYLRSCGIYLTASVSVLTERNRPEHIPLRYWPAVVKRKVEDVCISLFSDKTAPWFLALLTNQANEMPYADRNLLKLAGLYHCVCTSGMHISVLLGMISLLCFHRKRLAACIGLPLCVFFWAVAGGTPSASRAIIMQSLLLLAPLIKRETDTATSIAFSLMLILLFRPDSIVHLGLQLSFLSISGIALISPGLYRWMQHRPMIVRLNGWISHGADRPHWLIHSTLSSLSTAVGALLLTSPLLAWKYGILSLIAPLSGLLCLPLITICFAAGLPIALLGIAAPGIAAILAVPLEWLMRCVIMLSGFLAVLPFSVLDLSSPYRIAWLVLAYGFLPLIWLSRSRPAIPLVCLSLSFCLVILLQSLERQQNMPDDGFRLTALDVGQGQCLVLRSQDQVCVIDCGGDWPEDAGETCARYLLAQGIRSIDALALTHYHSDHAGGVPQLLSRIAVETLILPDVPDTTGLRDSIVTTAETQGASMVWVTSDETLTFGNGTLTALSPRTMENDNEACLTLIAAFGTDDILVTGDMDSRTELLLGKTVELPDVEIYIAGHHGSRDASSSYLLQKTSPEVVIVSAGKNNRYGHPHEETLMRIASLGAAVLRTDELGNISIER